MQSETVPTLCPDCGHPVYRPLLVPVRHPQHACRAVRNPGDDAERCGCDNAVHRLPTQQPRHRSQDLSAVS